MATGEHTINDALATALRTTRRSWRQSDVVRSENFGVLKGSTKRPDVLIIEPDVSAVVIETEILPATTVELEASSRLGIEIRDTGSVILSSIAVRLPPRFRQCSGEGLGSEIGAASDLQMALYTGVSPDDCERWPRAGWIVGAVTDLSILAQSAAVPPAVIDETAERLVAGVSEAATLLNDMALKHPGAMQRICEELRQHGGEQTRRMAATILVNAFVFQDSLAGGPGELSDVHTVDEMRDATGRLSKSSILNEWRTILRVNYWPIFDIARRILEIVPAQSSRLLLERLSATAASLLENRLTRSHDLTGAVFQRVIADRKFLAAFYTTPAAAALLTGLAINPILTPASGSWLQPKDVCGLRVADFACGTGTLLSSAYQRIGQLHELAGGDSAAIHANMMAAALVGCDVLPAATHLTASMLAGAHPTVKYAQSSIMTVGYGLQSDGRVALGSLDLLDPQGRFSVLAITAAAAEGLGEAEREVWKALPHATFDLVLMNPPFTRATGHEGKKVGVPIPMFAAFASSSQEQRAMAAATKPLTRGTTYHGNAGEASIFLSLAHRKLKQDGVLGLVMPLSLVSGDAWEKSRQLLRKSYRDLIVVSIAGGQDRELSFSADTDMGECLIVGRKGGAKRRRGTFAILFSRPSYPMMGTCAATEIQRIISAGRVRRLEDGPVGGTSIRFGDDLIGTVVDVPLPDEGGWNVARVADISLAQTAYQLSAKARIWLPGIDESDSIALPMGELGSLGEIGPYHMDVCGDTAAGDARGPFEISTIPVRGTPTYPVLWSHDAERERTMEFPCDSEGIVRQGANRTANAQIREKVKQVWESASHCHFNRDFRFNSQSTSMQFTPRRTIGGRAWISVKMHSVDCEKALTAWGNTSLGILAYWWHSNKQQSGRGSIGKSALHSLKVLDVASLTKRKLGAAVKVFDDFRHSELRPINEISHDPVRQSLDERFAVAVLGIPADVASTSGPLGVLREKLALEPSIRGSKGIEIQRGVSLGD